MKNRVREAVFDLIGPEVTDKHVIDLFAGSGALALEALSRGASRATLVERHFPTAKLIRQNLATLDVTLQAEVFASDTFFWVARLAKLGPDPCLVFCSPPYALYIERPREMSHLIGKMMDYVPKESLVVVEADERFDVQDLPRSAEWDVRKFPPAVVGLWAN